ncbi:hypothetical protein HHI36_013163 [Cryptolaemus montrouzieri]|uniref:Uncharacterized protein n=1 Tax=Cryptolaemus montrouzieri TaxID=559131 RepID=A0ABD2NGA5_9CUCU
MKKKIGLIWGLLLGNIFCFIFLLRFTSTVKNTCFNPIELNELHSEKYKSSKHDINLIMVGVMTAPKYFTTRAKAVYDTWGREVPGTIKFYSSEGSSSSQIPLIALKDVDDSYPPQKNH